MVNLEMIDYVCFEYGVYVVWVGIDGEFVECFGVVNFGYWFMVDGLIECFEIYLFDFDGDLYGKMLSVGFEYFIWFEMKFDGLDVFKV